MNRTKIKIYTCILIQISVILSNRIKKKGLNYKKMDRLQICRQLVLFPPVLKNNNIKHIKLLSQH